MVKLLFFFGLALGLTESSFAQSCGCDVTIVKEGSYDGKYLNYQPGQTICLQAGTYKYLYFRNLIGSASAPIKLINCGGQVTVGTDAGQNGIQFWDSKYVYLSGRGSVQYAYGIKLTQTPANYSGVVVTGFSSNFEIEGLEVSGTGFAGMMIKQDPTCDPATWRGNFAMYNIKVHGNYIHDTGAEGLYIGSSFGNSGMVRTCNGISQTVYPHNIYGLKIYRNRIERTGAEGIQYACSPEALVYDNTVRSTGVAPFDNFQSNGIQASGGVSGRLFNNQVYDAPGAGIIILGHSGTNLVYNNLVVRTGESGVFCDNRDGTPPNNSIIFTNNTIVQPKTDGFRLYNKLDVTTLTNNTVIEPGSGKLLLIMKGVRVDQQANYLHASLSGAQAAKVMDMEYKPLKNSPLVDKGVYNAYWNITTDLVGNPRPAGGKIDIGAYEYQPGTVRRQAATDDSNPIEALRTGGGETFGLVDNLLAYPSPCAEALTLRLNIGVAISDVTVYNPQGFAVVRLALPVPIPEVRLRTAHLASGLYFVRVVDRDGRVVAGRVIKQ